MSKVEVILKQEAGVKAHESESPPTVGGPLPTPPMPPTQTPTCPYCRSPSRYIQQYQRWYCDKEKRYV